MQQKKGAPEYQESQQHVVAEAPGVEPMTGAQASYPSRALLGAA